MGEERKMRERERREGEVASASLSFLSQHFEEQNVMRNV